MKITRCSALLVLAGLGLSLLSGCQTWVAEAGITVNLSSSNTDVARVSPSSVTVPKGQTTARFQVNTSRVLGPSDVTITAEANGITKSAVLHVMP